MRRDLSRGMIAEHIQSLLMDTDQLFHSLLLTAFTDS